VIWVSAAWAGGLHEAQEALILGHESMTTPAVEADPEALETLAWAEDLYRRGLYKEAWLAFDQAAFELGEAPEATRARFRAGESLWAADELGRAEQIFAAEGGYAFVLAEAETMYMRGNLTGAGLKLQLLPASDAVLYRQAWIWIREGEVAGAAGLLEQVPGGPLKGPAEELAAEVRAWEALPYRSPWRSVGLSALMPGAGQFLTGERREGVSVFLLTAALSGTSMALAQRDLRGGAALFGGFAVSAYALNLNAAARAAREHNEALDQERLDALEQDYELSIRLADEGMDLVPEVGP